MPVIIKDSMAEWSNATDSRSVLFGGAGSNPAGVIIFFNYFYLNRSDI